MPFPLCYCGNNFTHSFDIDGSHSEDWWRPFSSAGLAQYARFVSRVIVFRVGQNVSYGDDLAIVVEPECSCHAYLLTGTRHGYDGIDFEVMPRPIAGCPCDPCANAGD